MVGDLKREMVLLPTDYLQGANGTDQKPALYVTMRVVKYLKDKEELFVDVNKWDGYHHVNPYHQSEQVLN